MTHELPLRIYPVFTTIILALAATEYILVFVAGSAGVLLSVFSAVAIYAIVSVLKVEQRIADAVENMSLLFVYIILSASIPWFFLRQDLLIPGVYTLVLALCFWKIHLGHLAPSQYGFRPYSIPKTVLLGLAGIPLGFTEFLILRPLPPAPTFQPTYLLEIILYMFVFVGLGEELLFRGLIQTSLSNLMGPWQGLLWASVAFAVMHTVWRSLPEVFFTFAAGLLLGYVYKRTGSLQASIMIHAVNNILLLALLPYLL